VSPVAKPGTCETACMNLVKYRVEAPSEAEQIHREIGDVTLLAIDSVQPRPHCSENTRLVRGGKALRRRSCVVRQARAVANKGGLLKGRIEAVRRTGSYRFAWHLAQELRRLQMEQGDPQDKVEALEILMCWRSAKVI
jgi:hypothetical protein